MNLDRKNQIIKILKKQREIMAEEALELKKKGIILEQWGDDEEVSGTPLSFSDTYLFYTSDVWE